MTKVWLVSYKSKPVMAFRLENSARAWIGKHGIGRFSDWTVLHLDYEGE